MKRLYVVLYGAAAIVTLWYAVSFLVGKELIPWPHAVVPVFLRLVANGVLLRHGAVSVLRLAAGLSGALIVGVPLGIFAGVSRRGDRLLTPIVYLAYPVPKIAFLPVFILLFGLGDLSKILLLMSVIVFQIILAARDGVRALSPELRLAVELLDISPAERLYRIYLPATLPRLFSAARISIGIGMAVLFFAENYATTWGLGYFVMNAWVMIDYPMLFAGIIALGIYAAALLAAVDALHRRLCRWDMA